MKNIKIDFVIPWVDNTDKEWQKQKRIHSSNTIDESNSDIRYRDWGLLKYWFRAIEKNAPWVNNIYFITCGQKPDWLDENNPKLKLINHNDFIPTELLPTFNANVIENNLFRIKDLEEHFVYFNDDQYIINEIKPTDFFKDGKPCDSFCFNAVSSKGSNNIIEHIILNDGEIIEKYFNKKEVIKNNFFKIFNLKYKFSDNIKSLLLLSWKHFTGIQNQHIPCPYLKSKMKELWDLEYETLYKGSSSKFRTKNDINIWLFRYWNLYSGNFYPRSTRRHKFYEITNDIGSLNKIISSKKYQLICINDSDININFDKVKQDLIDKFDKKFPNKSSFEK